MANLTIRNIPDEWLNKIRLLSIIEKRSLNSQLLMVLEKGLSNDSDSVSYVKNQLSNETQIKLWRHLCGRWEDSRNTAEIITDIIDSRSQGRSVDL